MKNGVERIQKLVCKKLDQNLVPKFELFKSKIFENQKKNPKFQNQKKSSFNVSPQQPRPHAQCKPYANQPFHGDGTWPASLHVREGTISLSEDALNKNSIYKAQGPRNVHSYARVGGTQINTCTGQTRPSQSQDKRQ